jgi:aryl-alcohol dehydrogenase-like predicted oxidoreductase
MLMQDIASSREGASVAQVALNWLLARPGIASVLIGARTGEQLRDNLGAMNWRLTQEELTALSAHSTPTIGYPRAQRAVFEPSRNPAVF